MYLPLLYQLYLPSSLIFSGLNPSIDFYEFLDIIMRMADERYRINRERYPGLEDFPMVGGKPGDIVQADIDRFRDQTSRPTITATFAPIVAMLLTAEDFLTKEAGVTDLKWHGISEQQRYFLDRFFHPQIELRNLLKNPLYDGTLKFTRKASFRAEDINRFLTNEGFDINLQPWEYNPPYRFGAASVMDVLVNWFTPGESVPLRGQDGNMYPGVKIKEAGTQISSVEGIRNPVVYLPTKNPLYMVGLSVPEQLPTNEFELLEHIHDLKNGQLRVHREFEGVIFPKVSLDQQPDISWLRGLTAKAGGETDSVLEQVLQQTKFKMNEIGAHARSAVAGGFLRMAIEIPKAPYVIDKPFVCWIQKENIPLPLFAAYINYSDWKDPGTL